MEKQSQPGYHQSSTGAGLPKIQILTIKGLLEGTERPRYPDPTRGGLMFKKAKNELAEEQEPSDQNPRNGISADLCNQLFSG